MSVYKNIMVAVDSAPLNLSSRENALVESNLEMVHLWEHKDKTTGHLSGGMEQRVAIARLLSTLKFYFVG